MFFKSNLQARLITACALILSITFKTTITYANQWDYRNDPSRMAAETKQDFEYDFNKLPTEAYLSNKPWPDDYWPTYQRGLAHRWQGDLNPVQHPDESDEEFAIRKEKDMFFTKQEVLYMSEDERNKLSPAEKFDIINGDFDYALTKMELNRTSPDAPRWEGICHGWAAAAIHFDEPNPCKLSIRGNILTGHDYIPFASSDVKGLLSLLQGNFNDSDESYFAGTRCNDKREDVDNWDKSMHRNDINPGAFHLILSNRIGLLDKGFVFDRTMDQEVWNQPVEGFKTRVLKEQDPDLDQAAPGTKKEVVVETLVRYTVEISPHTNPRNGGDRSRFAVDQKYQYILELDENNKVIGGRWISENYPDFVWSRGKASFNGPLKNLRKIYNKATNRWFFQ